MTISISATWYKIIHLLNVRVLLGLLLVHGEEGDRHGAGRHGPHHVRVVLGHRLNIAFCMEFVLLIRAKNIGRKRGLNSSRSQLTALIK